MHIFILTLVMFLPASVAWVAVYLWKRSRHSAHLVTGLLVMATCCTILPAALLASGWGFRLSLTATMASMGCTMLLAYVLLVQVLYHLDAISGGAPSNRLDYTLAQVRHWLGFMAPLVGMGSIVLAFSLLPYRLEESAWVWVLGVPLFLYTGLYALYPAFVSLTWKTTPLQPGPLRNELLDLARKAQIGLHSIVIIQDNHPNQIAASVSGLLPWYRQVCLSEEFLRTHSAREIRAVFAHELGHLRLNHLTAYWALSITTTAFGGALLFLTRHLFATNMLSFVLRSVLITAATMAVIAWASRRNEFSADRYACQLTGDPGALVACLERLKDNRTEAERRLFSRLWSSHPSPRARIEQILHRETKT